MKYVIMLGDGMADLPIKELGDKTPLEVAKKPHIDALARVSEVGIVRTVPEGMKPASDIANLSVLGYNPREYYSGRSPLEAVSIGVEFSESDVTYRTNIVTLSDEENYADKSMVDYSAGEITTAEARELILAVQEKLGDEIWSFHAGISYRHCLLVKDALDGADLTPPHDISGKKIGEYLPKGVNGEKLLDLMKKSYDVLKNHPVNLDRIKRGLRPGNSIWFWGEGRKPALPNFKEKFSLSGAMISAVDLLKGIAKVAGMEVIEVEGATGNIDTNYIGKAKAALDALTRHDFVYIHVEAPDECGHRGECDNKVVSIEDIDEKIVKVLLDGLKGEEFSIMILPDHPTPISIKTHSSTPVPYLIYRSNEKVEGVPCFSELYAESTGIFEKHGDLLINKFLKK
ncbi:MAG: cofactor-independent phosphoglycerate mutase [Clostridia bacterium]|nr:cofactor-independent phosphoglycerate mutase [Clostridia bacterium]